MPNTLTNQTVDTLYVSNNRKYGKVWVQMISRSRLNLNPLDLPR